MSKKNYSTPSLITPLFVKSLSSIIVLLLLLVGITTLPAQEVGNLTIIKDADPADNTAFEFIASGPGFCDSVPGFLERLRFDGAEFNGFDIAANGDMFVTDAFGGGPSAGKNSRIVKLNKAGEFLEMWGWGVATGANQFEICTSDCQLGISGDGQGQFDDPTDLALDGNGNIFIVGKTNERIQKFTTDGVFVSEWGSSGSAEGQFAEFGGIDIDEDGNVYVTDKFNYRVQKFDNDGNFLSMWGWGVATGAAQFEICTSGCQTGINGTEDGQFGALQELSVSAGQIFVRQNIFALRIQVFSTNGTYLRQWDLPSWSTITGADKSGNLYAIDNRNDFILKYDSLGNQLINQALGSGLLNNAAAIRLDSDGFIFVTNNSGGNNIHKIAPYQFTLQDPLTNTMEFLNVAAGTYHITEILPHNWELDNLTCTGGSFTVTDSKVTLQLTDGGDMTCTFSNKLPRGNLTIIKEAIPEDDTPFEFSISGKGVNIDTLVYDTSWGSEGMGQGQFDFPYGLTIDANDHIFVVDHGNNRIQKFDKAGNFLLEWGSLGTAEGQFDDPYFIALDPNGHLWVTDYGNYRIQQFDVNGTFLQMWGWGVATGAEQFEICTNGCQAGIDGTGEGQFYESAGIAIDPDGNIFVGDGEQDAIQKFAPDGTFLLKIEAVVINTATNETDIIDDFEAGMWADEEGNIYVAHDDLGYFFKLDNNGQTLQLIELKPDIYTADIGGITMDDKGNIYVTDWGQGLIQKFDKDGNFLTKWGVLGNGEGQLDDPTGLAFDSEGNLLVVDERNDKVLKYAAQNNCEFTLMDPSTNTKIYTDVLAGEYVISELLPPSWEVSNITCTGGSPQVGDTSVMVTLSHGDDITCTFSNLCTTDVNDLTDNIYCAGVNTSEITFNSSDPNTLYTWTNDNTAIGLAASGQGNIVAFTAMNNTMSTISATISVTPYLVGANGMDDNGTGDDCVGTVKTFTITVFLNSEACEDAIAACTIEDLMVDENVTDEGIFQAITTLTSNRLIENNTNVIFKAGTSITLQEGFHAVAGSNFTAMIEACPATLVASEARNQTKLDKTIEVFPEVKIFPNPVQSYTNISISLSEAQEIQLDIYDLNGRRITTIVPSTYLFAGSHLFEWSCDQVDAGIYFVMMNGRQVGRLAVIN